jgi:nicotinate-nucleotide adenylyltransferase
MLRLATANVPGFKIDERLLNRDGTSYMVDSLAELRREHPHQPLILLTGQDSANTLETWHEWRNIFTLAHLAVLSRPGDREDYPDSLLPEMESRRTGSVKEIMNCTAGRVIKIKVTGLSISSSGIRKQIRSHRSPRFLLPDPVLKYIQDQHLYDTG